MTANQLVSKISHEIGGSGNAHLAMTIEEVSKYLPREISLRKLVYPKIAKDVGRETGAVERSVNRAVKSCCDCSFAQQIIEKGNRMEADPAISGPTSF